jgi:hypothetical protein
MYIFNQYQHSDPYKKLPNFIFNPYKKCHSVIPTKNL